MHVAEHQHTSQLHQPFICMSCRKEFKSGKDAQAVADSLADIALKRYTADNVAVVVADLKGSEGWAELSKSEKGKGLFGLFT